MTLPLPNIGSILLSIDLQMPTPGQLHTWLAKTSAAITERYKGFGGQLPQAAKSNYKLISAVVSSSWPPSPKISFKEKMP